MTDRGSFLLSDSDANLGVTRLEWIGRVLCGLVDLARMPVGTIRVGPLEAERCLGAHAQRKAQVLLVLALFLAGTRVPAARL